MFTINSCWFLIYVSLFLWRTISNTCGKVKIFWEGHKNLKTSPTFLTIFFFLKCGRFFQIFLLSRNIWTLNWLNFHGGKPSKIRNQIKWNSFSPYPIIKFTIPLMGALFALPMMWSARVKVNAMSGWTSLAVWIKVDMSETIF